MKKDTILICVLLVGLVGIAVTATASMDTQESNEIDVDTPDEEVDVAETNVGIEDEEVDVAETNVGTDVDTPDKVVDVGGTHIANAEARANNISVEPEQTASPFVQTHIQKSQEQRQAASNEVDDWDRLMGMHTATIHSAAAEGTAQAEAGGFDSHHYERQLEGVNQNIVAQTEAVSYTGENADRTLALTAEIERSISSANNWESQGSDILGNEEMSETEKAGYASSSIEGAKVNLNDARMFQQNHQSELSGNEEYDFEALYEELHTGVSVQADSSVNEFSEDTNLEYKSQSYLDRAEVRADNDLYAAAILDLLYADQYQNVIDETSAGGPEDPTEISEQDVKVQQQAAVDAYQNTLDDAESDVIRLLLEEAHGELADGTHKFKNGVEFNSDSELQTGYTHYRVSEELSHAADNVVNKIGE